MNHQTSNNMKSVKSINPFKSVFQTMYDIVKAHSGEIKVKTEEGEARPDDPFGRGTTFIIQLPVV